MNTKHSPQFEQVVFFWFIPVVASLLLLPVFGTNDMWAWLRRSVFIDEFGLIEGYQAMKADYPPGVSVMFYLSLQIEDALPGIGHIAWKIPLLISSWLSAWCIWFWSRNHALALLGGGLCCYFGVGLSYLDVLLFPPLFLSFYFLARERNLLALLCYGIACYIKYPPLIIGPFIFVYLLRKYSFVYTMKVGVTATAIVLLACLPFIEGIIHSLIIAFKHSILSAQALNFNWLLTRYHYTMHGPWAVDINSLSMLRVGNYPELYVGISRLTFYSGLLAALWLASTRKMSLELMLATAFMGYFSYFMFMIGAHENHFFYAALILIALCCINPNAWFGTAMLICGINAINVLLFYGFIGEPLSIFMGDTHETPIPIDMHLLVAAFNFSVYGWCWISTLRRFDQNTVTP